jgi:hypothetical protein
MDSMKSICARTGYESTKKATTQKQNEAGRLPVEYCSSMVGDLLQRSRGRVGYVL